MHKYSCFVIKVNFELYALDGMEYILILNNLEVSLL